MFPRKSISSALLLAALSLFFSISLPPSVQARDATQNLLAKRAPPPAISLQTFTTRDGLAGNFVTSLALASDNSVWVGTANGATHIENSRWTTFTHVHGLGDDWVTAVAVAPDQRVWFGTHSGGVSVFDPAAKKFTTYNISNSSLPSNFITALAVAPNNAVWVSFQSAGIVRFDPNSQQWTHFDLANNSVTALASDARGTLWAGTDSGVFQFDGTRFTHIEVSGAERVKQMRFADDGSLILTTAQGRFRLAGNNWTRVELDELAQVANVLALEQNEIVSVVQDKNERIYFATPRGLGIADSTSSAVTGPAQPLPVVLVHGWTGPASDEIQDSEFRFLKEYAERDGIRVFFAKGISPKNTLFENAEHLRDAIAEVKKATGAFTLNVVAFSMGGLNTRAYLESSLYADDVNRAIIFGTPEAGVDIWKPILLQQIIQKPDEPSAIELAPEYASLFNATHAARANVPYDLLVGDARKQPLLEFIDDLPPSDGLIGVASALSLVGANVRHQVSDDLHAYEPTAVPFQLTSYLYPRNTYERYLRNALRDPTNAPLGSEIAVPPLPLAEEGVTRNHTPVVTQKLRAGETQTRTMVLDENNSARFIAYFPGGDVDLSLMAPDGKIFDTSSGSLLDRVLGKKSDGAIGLKADIANFVGYSVQHAASGKWSLVLKRKDKGTQPLDVTTYADLDAAQTLRANVSTNNATVGTPISIKAKLNTVTLSARVTARVAQPAATAGSAFIFTDIRLFDDGHHDDGAASDGVFANLFTPTRGGYYPVFVEAVGSDFARGTEFLFAVNPGSARLGKLSTGRVVRFSKDEIEGFAFGLEVVATRAGKFAVGVTVRDARSEIAARISTPATLMTGSNHISVLIPASALATRGPYSLDLNLLDANWAALQIESAPNVATIPAISLERE